MQHQGSSVYFSVVKMGKRKTTYNSIWETDFKWLRSNSGDPSKAFCTVCSKSFRIDGGGKSQVEIHGQGTFHLKLLKSQRSQRTFVKSTQENAMIMSEPSSSLTLEEQVIRAETIQALTCVDSNLSFASADGDGDRFKAMFPDSKIAEKYSQNETKMKYVIQFGLSPYFQDLLKSDLRGKPFSFKFDETTTSQTENNMMVMFNIGVIVLML